VEDYFALVRVARSGVGMSSGKTEAAPAARAFAGPHHRFLTATGVDDMLIGSARIDIRPAAHLLGRFGHENRSDLGDLTRSGPAERCIRVLSGCAEPDVEIPLIAIAERLHPAGDGVLGKLPVVGRPDWIARVEMLVVTADPFEELRPAVGAGNLLA